MPIYLRITVKGKRAETASGRESQPANWNSKTGRTELADTCLAWHILPVFLTQPNQFGTGRDPLTGADLETYPVDPSDPEINGLLIWKILEKYNDVVRGVCLEKGLPMIDLAHLLPKNSLYFYDMSHFTNQGAEKVSQVLTTAMAPILHAHFPLSCR